MSHEQRLVYMANQIATFFASQTREDQVERTASHLRDFWDPRMREQLLRQVEAGEAKLHPIARQAAERLIHAVEAPPPSG
jgi:formate dehydrogenase subunit delta